MYSYYVILLSLFLGLNLFVPAWFAHRRGFAWYWWLCSGGLLSVLVLMFLPSADESGLDPVRASARRLAGNRTGMLMTLVIGGICVFCSLVLFLSLLPEPLGLGLPVGIAICSGIAFAVGTFRRNRLAGSLFFGGLALSLLAPLSFFLYLGAWGKPHPGSDPELSILTSRMTIWILNIAWILVQSIGFTLIMSSVYAGRSRSSTVVDSKTE